MPVHILIPERDRQRMAAHQLRTYQAMLVAMGLPDKPPTQKDRVRLTTVDKLTVLKERIQIALMAYYPKWSVEDIEDPTRRAFFEMTCKDAESFARTVRLQVGGASIEGQHPALTLKKCGVGRLE